MSATEMANSAFELSWFKSSYSSGEGGMCVEIATTPQTIHVRDSKNTHRPHLTFTPNQWSAFIDNVRIRQHRG